MASWKKSRKAGFLILTVLYLVATAVGVVAYLLTPEWPELLRWFLGDFWATVIVWLAGVAIGNSSAYDPYWSVVPPVMLTAAALVYGAQGPAVVLLLVAVWFWGIRLTWNWAVTFADLSVQDWRYDHYKTSFPRLWHLLNFFGINLMPTIVVFLCMAPALHLLEQGPGSASWMAWIGFCICIGAALLQFFADRQAHRFRAAHPGRVCDSGLWRYSRHPNYLGEILMWWGVYVLCLAALLPWWMILGAVVNTLLFLVVSIPLMERRQLARKPAYAGYRRTTSMLLILPKRSQK